MSAKCPDRSGLLLFLAGELTKQEGARVEQHLALCPECDAELSQMRAMTAVLARAGGRVPRADAAADHARRGVMSDCPPPVEIAAYVDGSLSPEKTLDVERHVARCRSCLSEVSDLWHMMSGPDLDAPQAAVDAALAKLGEDARMAVLRWAGRSVEVVLGFADALAGAVVTASSSPGVPVPAVARSTASEARLLWTGENGAELVGAVRDDDGSLSLTGRVTIAGRPAGTTSAGLASKLAVRGPESLDTDGRFGPWPLSPGRNVLRLTGLPGRGGSAELVVMIIRAEDPEAVEDAH